MKDFADLSKWEKSLTKAKVTSEEAYVNALYKLQRALSQEIERYRTKDKDREKECLAKRREELKGRCFRSEKLNILSGYVSSMHIRGPIYYKVLGDDEIRDRWMKCLVLCKTDREDPMVFIDRLNVLRPPRYGAPQIFVDPCKEISQEQFDGNYTMLINEMRF